MYLQLLQIHSQTSAAPYYDEWWWRREWLWRHIHSPPEVARKHPHSDQRPDLLTSLIKYTCFASESQSFVQVDRHSYSTLDKHLMIYWKTNAPGPRLSSNGFARYSALLWSWWRHEMETYSALLALCAGNSPVPVNSPHKGQWRGALIFSLICVRKKRLSKQPWGWWFETPAWSLWRQCNDCRTSRYTETSLHARVPG